METPASKELLLKILEETEGKEGKSLLCQDINPIQTEGGGGGFSNPPSGKIVINPTPKEL